VVSLPGSVNRVRRSAWAARTFAYHGAYNALARTAPRAAAVLQRLTRDTGRGAGSSGRDAAGYFEAVLADYFAIAKASGMGAADLFRGKRVLELGPGDTRALALLVKLEGASTWHGFDPFDIQSRRTKYLEAIYRPLLERRGEQRSSETWLHDAVVHTTAGALRNAGRFDVIVSRAVLEHVRDLHALFETVMSVAADDAVWIHKVDLRNHGVAHDHALDFLRFPRRVWTAMSSHIDLPNRERAPTYFAVADRVGLHTTWAATTHVMDDGDTARVRSELAPPFRGMGTAELSVLGLWLVQVGPRHPLASRRVTFETMRPAPHASLSRY